AMLLVSHDLGVIGHCCQQVAVMYNGEKLLEAPCQQVLTNPGHPYAEALLQATPRIKPVVKNMAQETDATPALTLRDLALCYRTPGWFSRRFGQETPLTVEGVSLDLAQGETVGLVGESGSGKSTILKAIAGLLPPVSGQIVLGRDGDLPPLVRQRSHDHLRRVQMIFQNADLALNPRQTVAEILAQPLRLYFSMTGAQIRQRGAELLDQVRLPAAYLDKLPGQLSGGEKQRVAIARAFAAEPEIVLCDEITSALDVSVQATVLELLQDLKRERGTSYIFVSHDLAVVQALSDKVMVLQHGRVCEAGRVADVYGDPQHSYTRKLFDAVLEPFTNATGVTV
ncbi:MAG: ATP-binding cassette domain-containing protein, partial [Pseudomonadota bacterium]